MEIPGHPDPRMRAIYEERYNPSDPTQGSQFSQIPKERRSEYMKVAVDNYEKKYGTPSAPALVTPAIGYPYGYPIGYISGLPYIGYSPVATVITPRSAITGEQVAPSLIVPRVTPAHVSESKQALPHSTENDSMKMAMRASIKTAEEERQKRIAQDQALALATQQSIAPRLVAYHVSASSSSSASFSSASCSSASCSSASSSSASSSSASSSSSFAVHSASSSSASSSSSACLQADSAHANNVRMCSSFAVHSASSSSASCSSVSCSSSIGSASSPGSSSYAQIRHNTPFSLTVLPSERLSQFEQRLSQYEQRISQVEREKAEQHRRLVEQEKEIARLQATQTNHR